MSDYGVEMTDTEIAEFLARHGHGVLSFGGDKPYGIPVSFGYDVLDNRCIFQLISDEDSKKQQSLDRSNVVNLVSYEWNGVTDWQSVIIDGRLTPIPDGSPDVVDAAEVFAEYASVVGLAVFEKSLSELTPVWYELEIEEMTGRRAPEIAE